MLVDDGLVLLTARRCGGWVRHVEVDVLIASSALYTGVSCILNSRPFDRETERWLAAAFMGAFDIDMLRSF